MLALVYLRPAKPSFALVTTGVDIAAISVLAVLSGGAFSNARLAFFLVPVAVAFRFRPGVTIAAVVVTTTAYVAQAVAHPAVHQPEAARFILTQAGFLAWVGVACVFLSMMLARRTGLVVQLAEARSRLLNDALEAEQRERKALADALHDNALQNLLSVRHLLAEVAESVSRPGARSRGRGADGDRRGSFATPSSIFIRTSSTKPGSRQRCARSHGAQRSGGTSTWSSTCAIRAATRRSSSILSAARELLANVVQHAHATELKVGLVAESDDLTLTIEDNGRGFPPGRLSESLREGHVGLPAQQSRIEAAGGRLEIASSPAAGTRVSVLLPAASAG